MSHPDTSVAVIVPCLNAEKTLAAAINSVLRQTVPPEEILVIDDGSTDRSRAVAASCDTRVRVLSNPGRGPGAARRFGVTQARSTYIAFVDADDVVLPCKHEKQLSILIEADPFTLVHTSSYIRWPDGRETIAHAEYGHQAVGACTRLVFERNPICGASTMIRRDVILALGNYDADLFGTEDFGLSLIASTRCTFAHVADPMYVMMRHDSNITRRASHMAYHHWLAQERFRLKCPEAFAALPAMSVREYMIEPVLRATREAYWRRDAEDFRRLRALARRLAPCDPDIHHIWSHRWIPFIALRARDRWFAQRPRPTLEAT